MQIPADQPSQVFRRLCLLPTLRPKEFDAFAINAPSDIDLPGAQIAEAEVEQSRRGGPLRPGPFEVPTMLSMPPYPV